MRTITHRLTAQAGVIGVSSSLILLCSCATRSSTQSRSPTDKSPADQVESVGNVDFGKVPELKDLAGHARAFANDMYPKVCALLADESAKRPRQFDIVLKPLRSRNTGETHLEARRIHINSDYLTNHPARLEKFEKVLVHEMAHMAQQYRYRRPFFWSSRPRPHAGWEEGIADYVLYRLVGTNGWACPQCDTRYPHHTSGYTCAGAFLLYVEAACGSNIVQQLNTELRQHSYTDAFFQKATGMSLDQLWTGFQKTAAFKPGALEAYQLQQALGDEHGQPPGNIDARFQKYVDRHADVFTRHAVKSASLDGKPVKDVRSLMVVYLYFSQPGGSAERVWLDLHENGGVPGIVKGEKGALSAFLKYEEMALREYPQSRTVDARKRGDPSIYHYTMTRASAESEWKLTKAWHAAPDGTVTEEFSVP